MGTFPGILEYKIIAQREKRERGLLRNHLYSLFLFFLCAMILYSIIPGNDPSDYFFLLALQIHILIA